MNNLRKQVKKKNGFTLIEVLVSVFILALVGTIGILALTAAINSRMQSDVRTTAVSLADKIMETAKGDSTSYQSNSNPADYSSAIPAGFNANYPGYQVYTLDNSGSQAADKVYGLPWNLTSNLPDTVDSGIQKVTIIIKYNNQETFRLADFKVDR